MDAQPQRIPTQPSATPEVEESGKTATLFPIDLTMTITESNVSKVISAATAVYWLCAVSLLWSDWRSGNWLYKGGWWMTIVLITGTAGMGFWVMVAPPLIRSLRSASGPTRPRSVAKYTWCLSTLPVVVGCFLFVCLLVYYRVVE